MVIRKEKRLVMMAMMLVPIAAFERKGQSKGRPLQTKTVVDSIDCGGCDHHWTPNDCKSHQ